MTHYVRELIFASPLGQLTNERQIPIFLQIMETMKMIEIMKIIQTIKMKVTTQQTNTCSKSTIEYDFFEHISHLVLVFLMSIFP